jgi:hypothetical protein
MDESPTIDTNGARNVQYLLRAIDALNQSIPNPENYGLSEPVPIREFTRHMLFTAEAYALELRNNGEVRPNFSIKIGQTTTFHRKGDVMSAVHSALTSSTGQLEPEGFRRNYFDKSTDESRSYTASIFPDVYVLATSRTIGANTETTVSLVDKKSIPPALLRKQKSM